MEKKDLFKLDDEYCAHCRNNPNGKKPYIKMMHTKMTELTERLVDKIAGEYKVNVDCVPCMTIKTFVKLPFSETIKILEEAQKHGTNKN